MSVHKAIKLEDKICDRLFHQGWIYEADACVRYVRALALFPEDVSTWVQVTRPKPWEVLAKNHSSKAGGALLARLRVLLHQRGTLNVLRHSIKLPGLTAPLWLAEFKLAQV